MTDFKAGIYIRLSEEDEGKNYEAESESIINQRNLLINYLKEKVLTLYRNMQMMVIQVQTLKDQDS